MTPKMPEWAKRDEVVAVTVTGEGDKALWQVATSGAVSRRERKSGGGAHGE